MEKISILFFISFSQIVLDTSPFVPFSLESSFLFVILKQQALQEGL